MRRQPVLDPSHDSVPFGRRPSGSPAIAALLAAGVIRPQDRVLDMCCGEGPDSLLLACSGVESVLGIESVASARATASRVARIHEVSQNVRFVGGDLLEHLKRLQPESFHVLVDTLAFENAKQMKGGQWLTNARTVAKRERVLVREIARVIAPGGIWIAHTRTQSHFGRRPFSAMEPSAVFPADAERYFDLSYAYPSHLAEFHRRDAADDDDGTERPGEEGLRREFGTVYVGVARRLNG